jgi:rod shape determining protein RodA
MFLSSPDKRRFFLIIFSVLTIAIFSLLSLFSIDRTYFSRQVVFWLISFLFCTVIAWRLNFTILRKISPPLYFFVLILLLLPILFGTGVRGSSRWIFIHSISIQPSEIAKPLFVIGIASLIYSIENKLRSLQNILLVILAILIPAFIVFAQPDLGSSLVFVFTGFIVLFFSRVKKSLLSIILAVGFLAILILSNFVLADYQKERLKSFLNPYGDPLGRGYNLIQAEIAIGSGGWIGKGIGVGAQTRLLFLPERHTDFIFSSFVESFGFLGVVILLAAYFILFWQLLRISFSSEDEFVFLTKLGLLAYLWFQVVVNIGMNLGLLPITGIPLPLFSYGGSSLVSVLISLVLILI